MNLLIILFISCIGFIKAEKILPKNETLASLEGHFGVSVYGWFQGNFGVAGSTRSLLHCLLSHKIPLAAINFTNYHGQSHKNGWILETDLLNKPNSNSIEIIVMNPDGIYK